MPKIKKLMKLPAHKWQRSRIAVARHYAAPVVRYVANQAVSYGKSALKRKRRNSDSQFYKLKARRLLNNYKVRGNKHYTTIIGRATGTTHTTSRLIVRRTPREQRFLRKLFRNRPLKQKYVNRFGFAWMGAAAANKTIWYSIAHLKFNNLHKYMIDRIIAPNQSVGSTNLTANNTTALGNGPDAFIYVGKCTFNYELYNPTNYIITVFVYDLICKRDTPNPILYNAANNDNNNAPEACMQKGSEYMADTQMISGSSPTWIVADSTYEDGTYYNTIGIKPTDYHLFNTMWKVKGMRKVILPPGSSHHHVVVFNPKKKVTKASLYYPHEKWTGTAKMGVAGLTQATLFGFQGQVAVEDASSTDNTTEVGTLPGKIIVNCVKKVNIWNMDLSAQTVISESSLHDTWVKPTIFTDLIETRAAATSGPIGSATDPIEPQ